MKILLIEDDESLITILTKSLVAHNFVVDAVKDGETGWNYGSTFEYDLIVLDIMLPKLDGISLCQRFRAEGFAIPILLLTAQENSTAKITGLDAGADDYVVKPFDVAELLARIRALLRRSSANPFPLLTWGDLLLNPSTCEVTYNEQPLNLTTKEYEFLELFLRDSHHVFSTEEILDRLWSSEEFPAEATVRSHIRRLRHKLSTHGAPDDFISTIRGRGYYLKTPRMEYHVQTNPSAIVDQSDRSIDLQYLEFLNQTWKTTKIKSLEQLTRLSQLVKYWQDGIYDLQSQQQARHIAHKLAGTLGIFGLTKATDLARELERLTSSSELLLSEQKDTIEVLVTNLDREIEQTSEIKLSHRSREYLPPLLIIDAVSDFAAELANMAASRGINSQILSSIDSASNWLNSQSARGILLRIPSSQNNLEDKSSMQRAIFWRWLQKIAQNYPTLPILVIGDRQELSERLEVVRRGGKLFLDRTATPEQAIDSIMQLINTLSDEVKVTIVDDDRDCLLTLPKLLQPWGFKVTTLADSQQFWTVLQTIQPDVLVLDINMPKIDGFELCQVLRSDPHWQRLPILFLSALTDIKTQNQAFRVGADDYLCKPVIGADLANRIINRLYRAKAYDA